LSQRDDAMSKFGHAIGALAEREDDFDDQSLDYAAELANPSSARDEAVAPHIAAAERELETSRSGGGSLDIFDRIAQAAESQFDETRGSTAKRVSELVDDRRVGTKRWTPSKTMKQRMEKLEAARAAAAGEPVATPQTNDPASAAAGATVASAAASAPSSSTATMVTPKSAKSAEAEDKADAELMAEEQRAAVAQPTTIEQNVDVDAAKASEEIEDDAADTLRVIPGARGRRRDRARKSRLDEDFEKVFDDDGKPSINSLRRKLRSSATAEAEAALGDSSDLGSLDGDDLQAALETERKQKRIAMPIIGAGAIIGLVGIGWVAYRFIFG